MTTKPNALSALLGATLTQESTVYIPRLKTSFTVKSLTNDEIETISAQATIPGPKGTKSLDDRALNAGIIAKGCVDPDFSDKALQAHYGASDAIDCVGKALLPGEVIKVLAAIMESSGFGKEDEMVQEAKN